MSIHDFQQLVEAQAGAATRVNAIIQSLAGYKPLTPDFLADATTGLDLVFYGGRWNGSDRTAQTVTFPASQATVYVEAVLSTGVISVNTTGYTSGRVPLGIAETSATGILHYYPESRVGPVAGGSSGATTGAVNVWTKNQSVATVALTDGSSIATDASLSNNFKVTLGGNRTLANPTNLTEGMWLLFVVKQDATGGRTLGYGSKFKWSGGVAPTLSTSANAVDTISAYYDGTNLLANFTAAYS